MPFPRDSQLWVRYVDGRLWEVLRPFTWVDDAPGQTHGWTVTVPQGFHTDYASIPRFLWPLLPKTGKTYTRAAVLHDYLYFSGMAEVPGPVPLKVAIPRAYADAVLRHAAEEEGCPAALRQLIYRGVRLGGWATWRRYRTGKGARPVPGDTPDTPDAPDTHQADPVDL